MRRYSFQEINDVYGKISPFEFKNKLINLAKFKAMENGRRVLDAGRGNPNWIAATPREAFFTFGQFAVNETRRTWNEGDLAGMPKKEGISTRFYKYIYDNLNMPGANLAKSIVDYGIEEFDFDPDSWVFELTDGIIGDNYPSPDKMLVHIEQIVTKYLIKEMRYDVKKGGPLSIFAVEGATAAMCYIFDSLMANELLRKGDKIAIMTPIFTPYLEIPHLPRYDFDVIFINADEVDKDNFKTWQYSKEELGKLKDKSIKALFLVNPNNPASIALDENSCNNLIDIVKNYHNDLMIISDDVYGTFVPGFKSIMASLPYNSIGAYSFSKYFGVTGWRLGTLALHENNVFDKLIRELPDDLKKSVNKRYSEISLIPDKISFIDRIVADSRMVALNHTAGLSTPQQVQMAFFSAFALIDKDDSYKNINMSICKRRQQLFYNALGIKHKENKNDASYYATFDIMEWATNKYGEQFANFIKDKYKPSDMLFKLANNYSIVLLSGHGFFGPEWSIRVSLANLDDESYIFIGEAIKEVLSFYIYEWNKKNDKK